MFWPSLENMIKHNLPFQGNEFLRQANYIYVPSPITPTLIPLLQLL